MPLLPLLPTLLQNGPSISLYLTFFGILLGFLSIFWSFGEHCAASLNADERCSALSAAAAVSDAAHITAGSLASARACSTACRPQQLSCCCVQLLLLTLPPCLLRVRAAKPQAARIPGGTQPGCGPQDPPQRRHHHAGAGACSWHARWQWSLHAVGWGIGPSAAAAAPYGHGAAAAVGLPTALPILASPSRPPAPQGATINVLGAGLTMLGLSATIGVLLAKTLTSATVNPFLATSSTNWNPVLAFDVFNVQVGCV